MPTETAEPVEEQQPTEHLKTKKTHKKHKRKRDKGVQQAATEPSSKKRHAEGADDLQPQKKKKKKHKKDKQKKKRRREKGVPNQPDTPENEAAIPPANASPSNAIPCNVDPPAVLEDNPVVQQPYLYDTASQQALGFYHHDANLEDPAQDPAQDMLDANTTMHVLPMEDAHPTMMAMHAVEHLDVAIEPAAIEPAQDPDVHHHHHGILDGAVVGVAPGYGGDTVGGQAQERMAQERGHMMGDALVQNFVDLQGQRPNWRTDEKRTDVKAGRFSAAEKETIRAAAVEYARAKGLPTDDFGWLFATTKGNKAVTQGAWVYIASTLPQRTMKQVWSAGTRLLHQGNYKGPWSTEEDAQLQSLVQQHGCKWKKIGDALGRLPDACRDRWRSYIKPGEGKKNGRWDDDEFQRLCAAVAEYKQHKAQAMQGEQAQNKRLVKDDVDWVVVAEKVGTRSNIQCLHKWYEVAPRVENNNVEWSSGDDFTLVQNMLACTKDQGVEYEYQVAWEDLVPGHAGAVVKRRWHDLTKQVHKRHDLELPEIAEALSQLPRYFNWDGAHMMLDGVGQHAGDHDVDVDQAP